MGRVCEKHGEFYETACRWCEPLVLDPRACNVDVGPTVSGADVVAAMLDWVKARQNAKLEALKPIVERLTKPEPPMTATEIRARREAWHGEWERIRQRYLDRLVHPPLVGNFVPCACRLVALDDGKPTEWNGEMHDRDVCHVLPA